MRTKQVECVMCDWEDVEWVWGAGCHAGAIGKNTMRWEQFGDSKEGLSHGTVFGQVSIMDVPARR